MDILTTHYGYTYTKTTTTTTNIIHIIITYTTYIQYIYYYVPVRESNEILDLIIGKVEVKQKCLFQN